MTAALATSDRQQFEKRLRDRRAVLREEIREALLRADSQRYAQLAGELQDAQELALDDLLAEVSHADVERDAEELRDIQGALGRLAAGTFGQCVQCGTQIPRSRLDAYPTAKRCLRCQQAHEQGRRPDVPA